MCSLHTLDYMLMCIYTHNVQYTETSHINNLSIITDQTESEPQVLQEWPITDGTLLDFFSSLNSAKFSSILCFIIDSPSSLPFSSSYTPL